MMHSSSQRRSAAGLRYVILLYAAAMLVGGLILCRLNPPFQVPDEAAHFFRAYQISQGHLFASVVNGTGGGDIDRSYIELADLVSHLQSNGGEALTSSDRASIERLELAQSSVRADFPNTASYNPLAYIPQALGIIIGQAITDRVAVHLFISRLCNLLAFTMVVSAAMWLAKAAIPSLVGFSCLPGTIFSACSASQDATILASAALAAAVSARLLYDDDLRQSNRKTSTLVWVLCGALLVLVLARPPYFPVSILILVVAYLRPGLQIRRTAFVVSVLLVLCIAGQLAYAAGAGITNLKPSVSAHEQLYFIAGNPLIFGQVLLETAKLNALVVGHGMIGILLSVWLPNWSVTGFSALLFVGLLAQLAIFARTAHASSLPSAAASAVAIAMIATAGFASALLIVVSQYLVWTPLHADAVEGMQGRYFVPLIVVSVIPFAFLLTRACRARVDGALFEWIPSIATGLLLLAIPISQILLSNLISGRYRDVHAEVPVETTVSGTKPSTTIIGALYQITPDEAVKPAQASFGLVTLVNNGPNTARSCEIDLPARQNDLRLNYRMTDPATNVPVGTPNARVDIGAGQSQTYLIAITSADEIETGVPLRFACSNALPFDTSDSEFRLRVHRRQ
jgi:uncharacterized membrane protein